MYQLCPTILCVNPNCKSNIPLTQSLPHHKSLSPASPVSPSLKWDNVKKELEGFAAMACSCQGGRINIQEFAAFLKLPLNPALQELFALFDRVSDRGVRRTHG